MQSRRNDPVLPHEKQLQEYRGRESYEQQDKSGRGGRSAAFPQRDYPEYTERHPQPLDADQEETALEEDDYSRTDYGPTLHPAQAQESESRQRENQDFVNGGYAPEPGSQDPARAGKQENKDAGAAARSPARARRTRGHSA